MFRQCFIKEMLRDEKWGAGAGRVSVRQGRDLKGLRVGKLWYDVVSGLSLPESVALVVRTAYPSVTG